jgi:hypothetical protein
VSSGSGRFRRSGHTLDVADGATRRLFPLAPLQVISVGSLTFDPLHVLGTDAEQAAALLRGRPVTPGEVEALAMTSYPWRRHARDPRSYWVTPGQAADILQVSTQTVRQLLDRDRLPHGIHVSGVRLMRRHDIQTIAQQRRRVPRQRRAG